MSSSIRLKQATQSFEYCTTDTKSLQWTFTLPSLELQQRGLTADVLQRELKIINEKSDEFVEPLNKKNKRKCYGYLIAVFVFTLLLIIGLAMGPFGDGDGRIAALLIMFGGITGVAFVPLVYVIDGFMGPKWFDQNVEFIRQHVEVDLNVKYQENFKIRWQLFDEMCVFTNVQSGQSSTQRIATHIDIVCLDADMIAPVDDGHALTAEIEQLRTENERLKNQQM